MADVVLDRIEKRFGDVVAVAGIDLTVRDQEFLILVGPSGCGKTTTLRMIAGLEEVTNGDIRIGGRSVTHLPPRDRDIAMVFQSYALYPHMTVARNMSFSLKLRKTPKAEIERRVKEVAAILGLTEQLNRKPRQLSGGQRQRVAVGAALCRQAGVLLFDEPLSNLDAKLRVHMRTELKRLHLAIRSTMVYVTHDQVEAMTMGDRIAVMNHGVLQQIGSPPELYDNPVNVFVAAFIGSPAMNFATAKAGEGHLTLGGTTLHLTGRAAKAAEQNRGRDLMIGFRPEDLELNGQPGSGAVQIPAQIDVVEYLGHEELIHAQSEGHEIVALVPSDKKVQAGEDVRFAIAVDKLHVFDPETELSLTAPR
jgi:multiple sugar transport system ATP-binding protein